jgi:hypothetical protein
VAATIGSSTVARRRLNWEAWPVPMHHRTEWIDFLEPVDALLDAFAQDERLLLDGASFETGDLPSRDGPLAVVPTL